MSDPATDAQAVSHHYWDRQLPVDVTAIARSMAVSVRLSDLGTNVFAILAGSEILIARVDPPKRQRMAIALMLAYLHLGHTSAHAARYGPAMPDEDEVYARRFATALLMPESEVEALAGELSEPEMTEVFGVPITAICSRLAELGVSTPGATLHALS